MMKTTTTLAIAAVCCLAVQSACWGQGFNTGNTTGGQTQQTAGGQANTGQVGAGLDGSSFGSGFAFDQRFGTSQITSIGDPSSGVTTARGVNQLSQFGMNLGFLGGIGGFGGRGFTQQSQQQQNQNNKIRAKVSIGFPYTPPPPLKLQTNANTTLARLPLPRRFSDVQVRVDGTTAVLVGAKRPQADIDLLRQLVLLQPGIYAVNSDALVDNAPSDSVAVPVTPEPVPPPREF